MLVFEELGYFLPLKGRHRRLRYEEEVFCLEALWSSGLGVGGFVDGNFCTLLSRFFWSQGGYRLSTLRSFRQLDRNLSNALSSRMRFQYVGDWDRSGLQHLFAHIRRDLLEGTQDFVDRDPHYMHLMRKALLNLS